MIFFILTRFYYHNKTNFRSKILLYFCLEFFFTWIAHFPIICRDKLSQILQSFYRRYHKAFITDSPKFLSQVPQSFYRR